MKKRFGVMFLVLAYFLLIGSTYFFAKPIENIILDDTEIKEDSNDVQNIIDTSKNKRYYLYEDNGVKLYDNVSEKSVLLNFKSDDDELSFVESETGDDVIGVGSSNGFYNIALGKIMYDAKGGKYFWWAYETPELISAVYSNNTDSYSYLLKTNEEKIFYQNNSECGYSAEVVNDNFIKIVEGGCEGASISTFYNKNYLRLIDDFFSSYEYNFESEYLYVNVDNSLYRYDENGNFEVLGTYEKLFQIFEDNSIVYLKDGYLHYENLNRNISKDVLKWESKYNYDPCMSGLMGEFDEEYMQFTVVYNKIEGDEGYTLYIRYDLNTKEIITEEEEGYPGHCGC